MQEKHSFLSKDIEIHDVGWNNPLRHPFLFGCFATSRGHINDAIQFLNTPVRHWLQVWTCDYSSRVTFLKSSLPQKSVRFRKSDITSGKRNIN